MSPHDLARRFLEFRRLRKQVQDLEQCATQNSQTGELRGTATKRGAENDNREPCRSSEPALKASLGKRLACVDRHHSETIDYRPASFRSGLAAAWRAPLDLQEVHWVSNWAVIMVWFITFALICAAGAIFLWRFEKYLEELTGPWIWE
jgi:hypothetical protein